MGVCCKWNEVRSGFGFGGWGDKWWRNRVEAGPDERISGYMG